MRSAEIVGRVIPFFLAKIPDHELAGVRVRARPRANEAAGASRRSFQFSAGAVRMGSSESVAASTVSAGRLAAISRSAGERFRPRRQSQPPISRHSTPAMTSSPNLYPQLLDLGLPRGLLPLVVPREAGQHRLSSRLLPGGNQVRMHIVAGRQLRHRRFLAKRLQRDLRLQLSRVTLSLPWHSRRYCRVSGRRARRYSGS